MVPLDKGYDSRARVCVVCSPRVENKAGGRAGGALKKCLPFPSVEPRNKPGLDGTIESAPYSVECCDTSEKKRIYLIRSYLLLPPLSRVNSSEG